MGELALSNQKKQNKTNPVPLISGLSINPACGGQVYRHAQTLAEHAAVGGDIFSLSPCVGTLLY